MPKGIPAKGFRMTKNRLERGLDTIQTQPESRFSINERFGFVSDMVKLLAQGDQSSVVITGPGGLGKSFNVMKALQSVGMKDITELSDFQVGTRVNVKKSFIVIKGYSTPKGLYRALYENKDGVIVFDD